jgi:hypothetical protein
MATEAVITLGRIKRETAVIDVVGTAPLIVHAWSKKAREMMLAAQQGKKAPKQVKDPYADFEASQYHLIDGRHGFPTMAFKAATVKGGARAFGKSVRMTELRQSLIFLPDGYGADGLQLTSIEGPEPVMREDMVRVGMGTADIRYRAEYREWKARLQVQFMPNVIDLESIIALIDAGGANGVGEWRPEKNGAFGTFEVAGA